MKNTNEIKIALRDATNLVNRLDKCGYQVTAINLNQRVPVITISKPLHLPPTVHAEVVLIREKDAAPERIQAARFAGCLVTWKAEHTSSQ